ncbi:MAG: T9SS type A sorting domain-containing protein [bacterium]|nr:T9SS type A sorting domain-containing protein [bacterium]
MCSLPIHTIRKCFTKCIGWIGLFALLTEALAQDSLNVTRLSRFYLTQSSGLAVQGNYAYIANGEGGLLIVNISQPNRPIYVQRYDTPGNALYVAVADKHAYVLESNALRIVNIQNPYQPTEVASVENLTNASKIVVSGNYAYVNLPYNSILIFNVSDPTNVYLAGQYATSILDLEVVGNYAYVINDRTLQILDVRKPNCISVVGSLNLIYPATCLSVVGSSVYVGTSRGLALVDVNNPAHPTQIGFYRTNHCITNLTASENRVYLTCDELWFLVINVTNPSNPVRMGSWNLPNEIDQITVQGQHVYLIGYSAGLRVISVQNPNNPVEVGHYTVGNSVSFIALSHSYAYACGSLMLCILEVGNRYNPRFLSQLNYPMFISKMKVSGDYGYVLSPDSGFYLINIQPRTSPSLVHRITNPNLESYYSGFDVSGNYAYFTDPIDGLLIYDLSSPTNPTQVGHLSSSWLWDVTVSGNYAYGMGSNFLRIINIQNPLNPFVVSQLNLPGSALKKVVVAGNYAYLLTYNDGFHIVHIGNPATPQWLVQYNPLNIGGIVDLAVDNHFAYLATQDALRILNLENPTNPYQVGYYTLSNSPMGVAVQESLIAVTEGLSISFYDCSPLLSISEQQLENNSKNGIPQVYSLLPNYPNPFNNETKITYTLPRTSQVYLALYDVQGRLVKTLIRGLTQDAGVYSVLLDGNGLASGVYSLKLSAVALNTKNIYTDEFLGTRKVVFLK